MLMRSLAAALGLALLVAAPVSAKSRADRASVPFANEAGGIQDWTIADSRTVYIQAPHHRWYRADLFADCPDLPYAETLGFATNPDGSFDAMSGVLARGHRCALRSLTRVDAPPAGLGQRPKG